MTHASNPNPAAVAAQAATVATHALRFESLFHPGRALVFPCDPSGRVELDALSERVRHNYLYARAVVGREFATPAVVPGWPDD
jgi:hypothetical protein